MTQLASDNFTRANSGTLGANWTANTTLPAGGVWQILSNRAAMVDSNGGFGVFLSIYSALSAPNDGYAETTQGANVNATSDQGAGPAFRFASGALTGYLLQGNTHETRIYKVVAGTFTQLGSDGPAVASGDVLRITCSGSSITAQKNGSTIITATDSAIASGGAGVWGSPVATGVDTTDLSLFAFGDLNSTIAPYATPRRFGPGISPDVNQMFAQRRLSNTLPPQSAILSGSSAAVATLGGSLSNSQALSGSISAKATNTGALSISIALTGSVAANATDLGSLSVSIALAAISSAVATNTGNLTSGTAAAFAGSLGAVARFGGNLSNTVALAGTVGSVATDAGTLGIALSLSGLSAAAAAFGGILSSSNAAAFIGVSSAKASFGGSLSVAVSLAGTIGAVSLNSAQLANAISFGGKSFAVASIGGILSSGSASALSGSLAGAATFGGNLTMGLALSGSVLAAASLNLLGISVAISLSATMRAVGSMRGSLTANGAPLTSVNRAREIEAFDTGRLIITVNGSRLIS